MNGRLTYCYKIQGRRTTSRGEIINLEKSLRPVNRDEFSGCLIQAATISVASLFLRISFFTLKQIA